MQTFWLAVYVISGADLFHRNRTRATYVSKDFTVATEEKLKEPSKMNFHDVSDLTQNVQNTVFLT